MHGPLGPAQSAVLESMSGKVSAMKHSNPHVNSLVLVFWCLLSKIAHTMGFTGGGDR